MLADIDRNSPVPLYHQLKTLIQERITSGQWGPGDRIPTEKELCQRYGISRSPVRQALNQLALEGTLIRRPGVGTFVDAHLPVAAKPELSIRVMTSDPYWSRVLDHVSSVWNEQHPDRRIAFQVSVVGHSRFYDLLSAAVGSGAAPDVAMVDCVWVAGLARSGFLYALEDLGSPWNHTGFVEDLYPAFVQANSLDGRLYGLPVKADTSLLWYRRDWFAAEGLSPPRDWDDLLDVAQSFLLPQVRQRYGLSYSLAFPGGVAGGEATVYNLLPFIWSAGGAVFDGQAECVVLDGAGTRQALQFLHDLVAEHHVGPPEAVDFDEYAAPRLLASGQVAMALGGSYESHIIRDASGWEATEFARRVGCVAPPAVPGERPVSTVGGTSYIILRQCRSPALVLDVLRAAVSPEVVGDVYRSMLQSSPCPSFYEHLGSEAEPLLAQISSMILAGRARPSIPEYAKVSHQLQEMFGAAVSGAAPVDVITRRAAEFIGAICERPCVPSVEI